MNFVKCLSLLTLALLVVSCASSNRSDLPKYDTVIVASPIVVNPIVPGSTFDAFEGTSTDNLHAMRAVVQLAVADELKGKYTRVKAGGASKWEQAKQAAQDKDALKILTMDFSDPNEIHMKKWITVAVVDPFRTFEIRDWDQPHSKKFKLYLQRTSEQKNTYFMVGVQKR